MANSLLFSKFYPETKQRMVMDVPLQDGLVTNAMTNSVILTGAGAATVGATVTLAHGLAETPSFAALTPLASGEVWLVPQASGLPWDGTNVYVATNVANLAFMAKVEV